MWIAGGKGLRYYTLVIMLIFSLFQIWASGDCKAGAIRLFPDYHNSRATMKVTIVVGDDHDRHHHHQKKKMMMVVVDNIRKLDQQEQKKDEEEEDLFHKYFNGKKNITASSFQGFEDRKRTVPSCPDPLHNK